METTKNILMVGVGGQGTILASKILSEGLVELGYDVKMSEIHGMSQRGGSVSTQIRYGKEVFAPTIGAGEADIMVSFETMEAARYISMVKPDAKIIINRYRIFPPDVLAGEREYPATIIDDLKDKLNVTSLDAAEIATDLGNPKCMNIVLLGALIKGMGLDTADWNSIIAKMVKPQFVELNQKALKAGMDAVN